LALRRRTGRFGYDYEYHNANDKYNDLGFWYRCRGEYHEWGKWE